MDGESWSRERIVIRRGGSEIVIYSDEIELNCGEEGRLSDSLEIVNIIFSFEFLILLSVSIIVNCDL